MRVPAADLNMTLIILVESIIISSSYIIALEPIPCLSSSSRLCYDEGEGVPQNQSEAWSRYYRLRTRAILKDPLSLDP
jgi:hypothetical protein